MAGDAKYFRTTGIEKEAERLSIEEKAYHLLKSEHKRIDELSFDDVYSLESIKEDLVEVANKEALFKSINTTEQNKAAKLSEILEMMLPDLAELYNWLGDNVFVITASRYDDIKNGVDLIVEISEEKSFEHLGLAIDITLSPDSLDKKISSNANNIKSGHLADLKYFDSDNSNHHGPLENIVKVVIAIDGKTLDDLAETKLILANLEKRRKSPLPSDVPENFTRQIKEIKEKLRTHPLQIVILEQIKIQLERYSQYSTFKISDKCQKILTFIEKIYTEKITDPDLMARDGFDDAQNSRLTIDIANSLDKILGPDNRESDF